LSERRLIFQEYGTAAPSPPCGTEGITTPRRSRHHAKNSGHLQLANRPQATTVEIPHSLLGAFSKVDRLFFEFSVDALTHVLDAMMKQP
jgi:hypothetical protein